MNLFKNLGALFLSGTLLISLNACGAQDSASDTNSNNSEITITDVVGRTVSFDKAPEKVILGEGRGVFATSIVNNDNPLDKVVAMGEDLKRTAPSYYEKLEEVSPELKNTPTIGAMAKGDVTVENLISYEPDVMIITKDHYDAAKGTGMIDKMEQADIKYVVTDFRQDPLNNTTKSVEIYGEVFNQKDNAKKFVDHWNKVVDGVREKTKNVTDKPDVFVWRAAGYVECCNTVSNSNLGEFVKLAGGNNLGDNLTDTEAGAITPEKFIEQNPEYIFATGGSWAPKKDKPQPAPHIALGYTSDTKKAQDSMKNLIENTPGFSELSAPKDGKLYGAWHQFYDSPFNYLAIEQFGKWLHPDLFKDVNMNDEFKQAHEEFMPFPASGVLFVEEAK